MQMNREKIKNIAFSATRPLPVSFLQKSTGQFFIFPFYHFVGEQHPPHLRHLYRHITPEQFKNDLEFLLKHYRPASIADLKEFAKKGKKQTEAMFFLSFDDGLRECYEVIYPILKKKGIEAAFFINPSFVGNQAMFFRFKISLMVDKLLNQTNDATIKKLALQFDKPGLSKLGCMERMMNLKHSDAEKTEQLATVLDIDFTECQKRVKPYMNMEQLKELSAEGFLIGGHSMNHPLFSELAVDEQISQVSESIRFVNEHINPELSAFAFPFTDFGVPSSVFKYIENAGDIDITFGTAGLKNDDCRKHIQRIPMDESGQTGSRKILRREYAYYLLKSFFGKNTIRR